MLREDVGMVMLRNDRGSAAICTDVNGNGDGVHDLELCQCTGTGGLSSFLQAQDVGEPVGHLWAWQELADGQGR